MVETTVPLESRITGRSALDIGLLYRHGIMLLGVSREGKPFRDRVRKLIIKPGDVLLLMIFVFLFVYIWFRGTFPRYRFDQLMDLGWKWLIPLALFNVFMTGLVKILT